MKPIAKRQEKSSVPGFFSRISARQRIIAGAVLIVVCTIIAFSARPPDSDRPAGSIIAWFFRPLDPFAQARKPYIKSDLHAIARVSGSEILVAVGSGGLIVRSNDLGKHWEPRIVTLTPEEINRLQETGKKVEDRNSDKQHSSKTGYDKKTIIMEGDLQSGAATATGTITKEPLRKKDNPNKENLRIKDSLQSLRVRKMSEQMAPTNVTVTPETSPENRIMKK